MLRRTGCTAIFIFFLLAMPRVAEADLIEFIWKMSGPQFVGGGFGCTWDKDLVRQDCRLGSAALARRQTIEEAKLGPPPRGPYFFFGGELLVSTGKNSEGTNYEFGQAWRAAVTPGVSFRSVTLNGRVPLYHGVGVTWDLLFGEDFRRFDKFGVTLTPAQFVFSDKYALAFKVRVYPNSYTPDEFGFGPRLEYDRPFEITYGVGFSYIFKARP